MRVRERLVSKPIYVKLEGSAEKEMKQMYISK